MADPANETKITGPNNFFSIGLQECSQSLCCASLRAWVATSWSTGGILPSGVLTSQSAGVFTSQSAGVFISHSAGEFTSWNAGVFTSQSAGVFTSWSAGIFTSRSAGVLFQPEYWDILPVGTLGLCSSWNAGDFTS